MRIVSLPSMKEEGFRSGNPARFNRQDIDQIYSESLKGLRARIEHKIDTGGLQVLAVTSAVAGEGKTLTAINLAANLASTERKKVLLVDLDLRRSAIARELDIDAGPGLSEFLMDSIPMEKVIRNSLMPGLSVIPGGQPLPSPADALAGDRFRSFLRNLRQEFDIVILDTPPVLAVPDAITVAEQVDAFILLFRLNHTPHKLFRQAVEDLGEGKIMGVVLNGEEKKSDKYYTRYYGKYYRRVDTESQ